MGDRYLAAGGMVDRDRREVLDERTAAPDVKGLNAVADAEDGFEVFVGVLEEEVVGGFAGEIGWGRGRVDLGAITGRVKVGGTAGEANTSAGGRDGGDLRGGGGKVDLDGFTARAIYCVRIARPGALVVGGVGAGGDRNSDAGLHFYKVNGNALR